MKNYSPFPLRIIQLFGFFPLPLEQNNNYRLRINRRNSAEGFSNQDFTQTFQNRIIIFSKRFFKSHNFLLILPIFYIFISASVIVIFLLNFEAISNLRNVQRRLKSSGGRIFYSALILKSVSHVFCAIVIKLDMLFYRRNKLEQFYTKFINFLEIVSTLTGKIKSNRFEKCFNIELSTFIIIITLWNVEMCWDLKSVGSWQYFYIYFIPVMLGYFHSIFVFLVVYFLNWYLEVLIRIQTIGRNKLHYYHDINLKNKDETIIQIEPSCWLYSDLHGSRKLENLNKIKNVNYTECEILLKLYNKLNEQIDEFNKLFRVWITLDIGHSLLRIVFSGFFISSMPSRRLRPVAQNLLTVVVYFYLIYKMCKKGSDLLNESEETKEILEALAIYENIPVS